MPETSCFPAIPESCVTCVLSSDIFSTLDCIFVSSGLFSDSVCRFPSCTSYGRLRFPDCILRCFTSNGFCVSELLFPTSFCSLAYVLPFCSSNESAACPGRFRLSSSLWLTLTESWLCRFSSIRPSRLIFVTVLSLALYSCFCISRFLSLSGFATRCRKVPGHISLFITD